MQTHTDIPHRCTMLDRRSRSEIPIEDVPSERSLMVKKFFRYLPYLLLGILVLAFLLFLLLHALIELTPSGPGHVTEPPPVRDPDDTYVETVEEQDLTGFLQAVCGEDLIRIRVDEAYRDLWGEMVYVRFTASERQNPDHWCYGDDIHITFHTVEYSRNPHDLPIVTAQTIDIFSMAAKPVIYLYPEEPTVCSVHLALQGELTCTYPAYGKGWEGFTAYPDGTLLFPDGKSYYCLYWEGRQDTRWDFSEGFCVKGEDTALFLEQTLAAQGLTPREANEFIIYWLPLMEKNPYNVISFQTATYTETAPLHITPTPDSLLRVFMAYYPSQEAVEIPRQELTGFERTGFTVVEWGGSQVCRPNAPERSAP